VKRNQFAGGLRITMALTIVVAMIVAGWLHRSPWLIALVTPAFTVLYALGKWNAWTAAWRAGGAKQIALATAVALPIQAVVAGVFYLLGLGLGRLVTGYAPIAALSAADALGAGVLFAVGVAVSAVIIRVEGAPSPSLDADATTPTEEPELDIDRTPLTLGTFFKSPGYWRRNASREALEERGAIVEKPPLAASEDMIAADEARLGIRLPETLRTLYGVMNGGHVGWLYVPLTANPKPVYDDWRGAFSIDYSSLAPLEELRTVAEHYADFTDDPDDIPSNADRLVILQARYGDMTLLDYSQGPEPRVLIVDFDKMGEDPIDIAFDTFAEFFAALRRDRDSVDDTPSRRNLDKPLGEVPEANRARRFCGEGKPHPFFVNATRRKDGSEPKRAADDALVAETQERLAVSLPASLVGLWRVQNGGGVAPRFIETTADGVATEIEVMRFPVPLEYVVSLADLSDRIAFPASEMPWKERHSGADRLMVLEADHGRAVLLDYRDTADADPAVLLVTDLDGPLTHATRFEHWDDLLVRLRFQRSGWDDVAKPHAAELSEAAT
jgi:SMI1 / KNR4 family (SUKH-1)